MERPTTRPGAVRGAAAALAIATLAGLTACGGGKGSDAGPGSDATSLPHHESSGQTSDDASDQPPAPGIEQENPKRFLARWAAAEARMLNTGKAGPYLALSRTCPACRQLAHSVARYYAAGGYIHGGAWRIDSVTLSPTSTTVVTYTVRAHAAPTEVKESSSGSVQRVPGRPVTYLVGLLAKGSSFTVTSRTLTS
jgi:hypothetical protein